MGEDSLVTIKDKKVTIGERIIFVASTDLKIGFEEHRNSRGIKRDFI